MINSDSVEPLATPRGLPVDPGKFATWDFAGLMVTYWCNAKCAFCYVYSGPDRGGNLSVEDAVAMWRGLDRLAARHGKKMRVHLAGGEPFGDWEHLLAIIRAAREAGLTPLEKIETNAFWARDDETTRARLKVLDELGMEMLVVSADVYHQEFVPFERVSRCVEMAREVLGLGRVRVRWWDFLKDPVETRELSDEEKHAAYRDSLARHKDRLTGRAADRLAGYYERFPAEHFAADNCVHEVLHGRHIHIDPYGNVFPGVCAGIILGKVGLGLREDHPDRGRASHADFADSEPPRRFAAETVDSLWDELSADWREHPVAGAVVSGGSHALMRKARELGYRELPDGYANKCHLCTHVRQYLFERGGWEPWVGPAECYANASDRAEEAAAEPLVALTCSGQPPLKDWPTKPAKQRLPA